MAVDWWVVIFSDAVRWTLSVGALAVAVLAGLWFLVGPMLRRRSLADVAWGVDGRHPPFQERLSSAVELLTSEEGPALRGSDELVAQLARQAARDAGSIQAEREISFRPARPRRRRPRRARRAGGAAGDLAGDDLAADAAGVAGQRRAGRGNVTANRRTQRRAGQAVAPRRRGLRHARRRQAARSSSTLTTHPSRRRCSEAATSPAATNARRGWPDWATRRTERDVSR